MKHTFKDHPLSDAEKLWFKEAAHIETFDPKVAKVKLYKKLPSDFKSQSIDNRLYQGNQLTLVGLRIIDPENHIFDLIDRVITTVRDEILKGQGITGITANEIAEKAALSDKDSKLVPHILYTMNEYGDFISRASGVNQTFTNIHLDEEYIYDEYLQYKNIDDVLERYYTSKSPGSALGGIVIEPFASYSFA